ncbi:MAG TPA: EthD domain-containing protein [Acidimicrobiales bacterium]|nr:EthD domain-containing protein [Acidimicrobiales bacterium]
MEKIIYVLTRADGDRLLGSADALTAAGATRIQVNLVDAAVVAAGRWRIEHQTPSPDAFVSLWLATAHRAGRAPLDAAVQEAAGPDAGLTAYLVTESCPLVEARAATPRGERTPGFAQIALLRRPSGQTFDAFLAAWLDEHTDVAIETQSTFSYTQNVVVRRLATAGVRDDGLDASDPVDGIVEECFPAGAMDDPHVFFDAVDDDERLADHTARMVASTSKFLDFDRIEVIPTSRYVFD